MTNMPPTERRILVDTFIIFMLCFNVHQHQPTVGGFQELNGIEK
jgi:hypothetical protein